MTADLNILWFLGMSLSIYLVFTFIGFNGLTNMFPEGKRAWHLPAQWAALFFFTYHSR